MEIDNPEQLKKRDPYPEGQGGLNKYYSDMLDRDDDEYEIGQDVCDDCWEDGVVSILDPTDGSCAYCENCSY